MVFSGAVFLYAFLPLTLAVYALAPQRGRNAVLLIASLLFYAFGEPVYVFLLLLSSVSNWALSLCIERLLTLKVRGIDMVEALKSVE